VIDPPSELQAQLREAFGIRQRQAVLFKFLGFDEDKAEAVTEEVT
jgi:hypothetical protein